MTIKEFEIQYALGSLSKDQLISIAGNNNASKKILFILSTDKDRYVKWRIANNSNTPTDILTKLSTDEDWLVKSEVAFNPNTPVEALTILSKDKDRWIKNYAKKTLRKLESMTIKEFEIQYALGALSKDQLYDIAKKSTSKKILTILSKDKGYYIRKGVAKNSNTPTNILTKLSTDEDWYVRYNIANNSNTPTDILTKLSTDKDRIVRWKIAMNSNTPIDTLVKLSIDEDDDIRDSAKETLIGKGDYQRI